MFSSSSTTPARSARNAAAPPAGPTSRSGTIITWMLLVIWAVLLAFGVISMADPEWLETLARKGRDAEADAYKHLGDNELKKGNDALAIAQYMKALSISAEQPDVLLNLGIAYLRRGDLARAETSLRQASRLGPTSRVRPYLSLHLGESAEMQNRQEEAIRYYEQALQEGGRPDLVYRKLGATYLAQKDYARAAEAFEKTLEAQTDPRLPYQQMLERTQEAAEQDSVSRRWVESDGAQNPSEAEWGAIRQGVDRGDARQRPGNRQDPQSPGPDRPSAGRPRGRHPPFRAVACHLAQQSGCRPQLADSTRQRAADGSQGS